MRKGRRRLDLWLPDNHPIFELPSKTRSEWIRQVVDLAVFIDQRLGDIDQRLQSIEARLNALGSAQEGVVQPPQEEKKQTVVDPSEFLKAFS